MQRNGNGSARATKKGTVHLAEILYGTLAKKLLRRIGVISLRRDITIPFSVLVDCQPNPLPHGVAAGKKNQN
jgi:hypothetical protein